MDSKPDEEISSMWRDESRVRFGYDAECVKAATRRPFICRIQDMRDEEGASSFA